MTLNESDFVQMFAGKLDATSAFMSGKLKIKGNMGLAMKLQKFMKNMPKPAAAGSGAGAAAGGDAGGVEATFQQIRPLLNENIVKDVGGVFAFELKGKSVIFFYCQLNFFEKLILVCRKWDMTFSLMDFMALSSCAKTNLYSDICLLSNFENLSKKFPILALQMETIGIWT